MSIIINGKKVGSIGYGLMGFTVRGPNNVPFEQAIEVMKVALETGSNFWNAADFYGTPDNNSLHLLNAYFTKYPEDASKVVLSVKTFYFAQSGPDCSPNNVKASIDSILDKLEGKCFVDVIVPARVDPKTPWQDTVDAILPYVHDKKIGGIGLSETKADTIRKFAAVTRIFCVELELSLFDTAPLHNGQAAACAELGVPIIAYSPLSRGFLSNQVRSVDDFPEGDFRRRLPRYQPDVFQDNFKLVEEMKKVAEKKGATVPQVAISWVSAQSRGKGMPIIPIPGATTVERVRENAKLLSFEESELANINKTLKAIEIKGDRYAGRLQQEIDM